MTTLKQVKEKVTEKARAKINIGLDIKGKRPDGYHEVCMIMQTVSLYDTVTLEKTEGEMILECDDPYLPTDENNLCLKAAVAIKKKYELPGGYKISLKKRIPVAAGLAGGSADAAAVLRAVRKLEGLRLTDRDLCRVAKTLGADVSFCVRGGTALSEGIGELLTPLPDMEEVSVLLVNPDFPVSTAEVYKAYDELSDIVHPDINLLTDKLISNDITEFAPYMGNVLENVTIPMHPEIQFIKDFLNENGADASLMSGSGPTVFGLFRDPEKMEECKKKVKELDGIATVFSTVVSP
ncbi:MAG: 4-(cytidine 5'-diphospho)-2-C-methyl-D-erythritol kinase [Lachnospiraceae bacterium]|nr:4-(cytidine 5'-diphospho)-2-C-methyl-D-erythritol kinase [Lachnospiraceae bacterium]